MLFETSVNEIVPCTRDVTSFRFPKPAELKYAPGQYMFVTINSGEKQLTHTFSFSSSPTEQNFIEFTKKFTNSEYSTALKAIKVGDRVKIDAPYGSFTFMGEHEKILLLAGGVGITPFRSMCRYSTDLQLSSAIVLLYGCRTEDDIVFGAELKDMQQQNPKLKVIFVLSEAGSNWRGKVGFITADFIKEEVLDYKERLFFACGPPAMVVAIGKAVAELGLPKTQLKLESFTGHM